MNQIKTNKMMKQLAIMAVIMIGLISIGSSSALAQGKCPDTLKEDDWRKCWIKEAKSGNKNLRDANLANADLKNIDLSNADLTNAQIVNANFSGANFSGANLSNANLGGTNFAGANFTKANLTNAGFPSTDLTNADFTDAKMKGSTFVDAKIGKAKINLTHLQCKVTTTGADLKLEFENNGSLKNGTIVYKSGDDQHYWEKGRILVLEKRDGKLTELGLVDGEFLNCNTPTKVTSKKTIECKVRTKGANLNARSLAGKLLFTIGNTSGVYVFEQSKDGRAKVSVFNDESNEFVGWVPRKYLVCDGD
jgi:hypothetical protein